MKRVIKNREVQPEEVVEVKDTKSNRVYAYRSRKLGGIFILMHYSDASTRNYFFDRVGINYRQHFTCRSTDAAAMDACLEAAINEDNYVLEFEDDRDFYRWAAEEFYKWAAKE